MQTIAAALIDLPYEPVILLYKFDCPITRKILSLISTKRYRPSFFLFALKGATVILQDSVQFKDCCKHTQRRIQIQQHIHDVSTPTPTPHPADTTQTAVIDPVQNSTIPIQTLMSSVKTPSIPCQLFVRFFAVIKY